MSRVQFRAWFSANLRRAPRESLRRLPTHASWGNPWLRQPLPQRRRGFW